MGIASIYPFLASIMPENSIIVEAGGHIGRDTKKLSARWPQGQIHVFEPVPYLFDQLVENTRHLHNITRYPLALSGKSGTAQCYVSSGRSTATSSLLMPEQAAHPTTAFTSQQVSTITLAEWASTYNISKVDFLWLDMQGAELAALQASGSLLHSVSAIYTEISLEARYHNNPLYPELKAWLEKNGFKEVFQALIKPTWGNALFVKANR